MRVAWTLGIHPQTSPLDPGKPPQKPNTNLLQKHLPGWLMFEEPADRGWTWSSFAWGLGGTQHSGESEVHKWWPSSGWASVWVAGEPKPGSAGEMRKRPWVPPPSPDPLAGNSPAFSEASEVRTQSNGARWPSSAALRCALGGHGDQGGDSRGQSALLRGESAPLEVQKGI